MSFTKLEVIETKSEKDFGQLYRKSIYHLVLRTCMFQRNESIQDRYVTKYFLENCFALSGGGFLPVPSVKLHTRVYIYVLSATMFRVFSQRRFFVRYVAIRKNEREKTKDEKRKTDAMLQHGRYASIYNTTNQSGYEYSDYEYSDRRHV